MLHAVLLVAVVVAHGFVKKTEVMIMPDGINGSSGEFGKLSCAPFHGFLRRSATWMGRTVRRRLGRRRLLADHLLVPVLALIFPIWPRWVDPNAFGSLSP